MDAYLAPESTVSVYCLQRQVHDAGYLLLTVQSSRHDYFQLGGINLYQDMKCKCENEDTQIII